MWRLLGITFLLISSVKVQGQRADWDFSLSDPSQSAAAGQTIVYSGTIENFTGNILDFQDIEVFFDTTPASSVYSIDFTQDFLAMNLEIPANGYTGSIFYLTWDQNAIGGLSGTGVVEMVPDASLNLPTLSRPFSGSVTSSISDVPEASGSSLLLCGMCTVAAVVLRMFRQSRRRISRIYLQ
jgi:hypothetical protein